MQWEVNHFALIIYQSWTEFEFPHPCNSTRFLLSVNRMGSRGDSIWLIFLNVQWIFEISNAGWLNWPSCRPSVGLFVCLSLIFYCISPVNQNFWCCRRFSCSSEFVCVPVRPSANSLAFSPVESAKQPTCPSWFWGIRNVRFLPPTTTKRWDGWQMLKTYFVIRLVKEKTSVPFHCKFLSRT